MMLWCHLTLFRSLPTLYQLSTNSLPLSTNSLLTLYQLSTYSLLYWYSYLHTTLYIRFNVCVARFDAPSWGHCFYWFIPHSSTVVVVVHEQDSLVVTDHPSRLTMDTYRQDAVAVQCPSEYIRRKPLWRIDKWITYDKRYRHLSMCIINSAGQYITIIWLSAPLPLIHYFRWQ